VERVPAFRVNKIAPMLGTTAKEIRRDISGEEEPSVKAFIFASLMFLVICFTAIVLHNQKSTVGGVEIIDTSPKAPRTKEETTVFGTAAFVFYNIHCKTIASPLVMQAVRAAINTVPAEVYMAEMDKIQTTYNFNPKLWCDLLKSSNEQALVRMQTILGAQ